MYRKVFDQWMFKLGLAILLAMLLILQYRLWVAEGGVADTRRIHSELEQQQQINGELERGNDRLASEIASLKNGMGQVEARAREQLGLVKKDETFFLLVEPAAESEHAASADSMAPGLENLSR